MLPRRGYEPVDDGDEDDARQSNTSSTAAAGASTNITPTSTAEGGDDAKPTSDREGSDGEEDGRITVRVLDVRGQFYPLRVHPESTVRELKQDLVNVTGVEFGRQRIIHGGKASCLRSDDGGLSLLLLCLFNYGLLQRVSVCRSNVRHRLSPHLSIRGISYLLHSTCNSAASGSV